MSTVMGENVTIKQEVDSDVEEIGPGEETPSDSGDELVLETGSILTTNYHDTRLPMLEDFRGPLNFTYRLPKEGSSSIKPTWEYSPIFNQVFIKMDRVLVVQFSFDTKQVNMNDAYIRAVLVYASADHVFSPVNRCAVHLIEDDPMTKAHPDKDRCFCPEFNNAGHVVRCKSSDTIYCYDPKSERHSVLCPVKNTADMLYSFRCKNSCPKGMHRRSTKLVFTLENGSGRMLARTSMNIKICSCPRRDMERLEHTIKSIKNGHVPSAALMPTLINNFQLNKRPRISEPPSPVVGVDASGVILQREEDAAEDSEPSGGNLPGEVIMKIRSEVRNIRQALMVIERRFTRIQELINEHAET